MFLNTTARRPMCGFFIAYAAQKLYICAKQ